MRFAELEESHWSDASSDATDLNRLSNKLRDIGLLEHFDVPDRSEATVERPSRESSRKLLGVPIPDEIGQYQLGERLGQGAMRIVFKAWHRRLKRPMVLKLLLPTHAGNPQRLRQFETEMAAIEKLGDHENIIRANDACEIIRQAARGLQYAHEHGVLHRDIKPSNLLVTEQGIEKLLDLGLAVFQHERDATATDGNYLVGTADYLAPERWRGTPDCGPASDVYSLGCTLYKLLCGEVPFSQVGPRLQAKRKAHLHKPIPVIRDRCPAIDEELANVLYKMLAKDPTQRFTNAEAAATALERFTDGADLGELVRSGSARSTDTQRILRDPTLLSRFHQGLTRVVYRKLLVRLVGTIMMLAIILAAGIAALGHRKESSGPHADLVLPRDSSQVLWG